MRELLREVECLKRSEVKRLVDTRIGEFKGSQKGTDSELFKELCFCLMAANFNAERSWKMQNAIGDGLLVLPKTELAKKLKALGHRFPNTRASYIVEARKHKKGLRENLAALENDNSRREWLVKNVKGIGYKEASHFLRNIGYMDVAVVDFHIVDLLVRHGLIERPKTNTITKKRYLEIEDVLKGIAREVGLTPGELDLYLWFIETGKVVK